MSSASVNIHLDRGDRILPSSSGWHPVGGCWAGVYIGLSSVAFHVHEPADLIRLGELIAAAGRELAGEALPTVEAIEEASACPVT